MHSITQFIKNIPLYLAVSVLGGFTLLVSGGAVFALDPVPCDPTPHPDSYYGAGVHHPNGTDASTFTYHCETDTWSNPYYVYYPASATRVATFAPNYSYNCATGVWTMDEWGFSASTASYNSYRVAASDPGLAKNCPAPATASPTPASISGGAAPTGSSTSIADTGTGSTNTTGTAVNLNGTNTNTNNLGANNILTSTAGTGNAFVTGNTTGGSAATGDAQAIANIANLLQSTTNAFGPNTTTFVANINGNVNGDFMFDPAAIMNTGANSTNAANNNLNINTNTANTTNAQINNNINVGANSGNATVASNTKAGDATTGNAQAVVNLMNLINSTVAAGHSFVGTVNINGSLNGDILLPQGVLDQLLASTGANSTNTANNTLTDNSTTTNNVTQQVTNNIASSALTGSAGVSGNTTGGSATSGQAHTGVTLLNLTGSNTIGKNSLLVFVNVLGKWVGMIMNAPAGTTAAELGGGITNTGTNSTNTANNTITDNSRTTNTANLGITNDVNVHATSGNATVAENTVGGNAQSGNASTAVNILNLMGSNISLSDWFGILFINVFGMWNGSFGVNTAAGDPVSNSSNNPVQAANQESLIASFKQFASFTPRAASGSKHTSSQATNTSDTTLASAVLGSETSAAQKEDAAVVGKSAPKSTHASYLLPIIGVSLAVIILLASERERFGFKRR